ncbi:MAG: hypothetical protein IKH57_14185 [Clostridia bacterium]|nr:hypothetical protein [Clostridia bacterium]
MAEWQYCVVGNIVKTRIDEEGKLRYGTSGFRGGTRVYLCGNGWDFSNRVISVLGISRGRRFQVLDVSKDTIENVRCRRTFEPRVMEFMSCDEFYDRWWHTTEEDKADAERFVEQWNKEVIGEINHERNRTL